MTHRTSADLSGLSPRAPQRPGRSRRAGLALACFVFLPVSLRAQTITPVAPLPSQWGLWSSHFIDAQKGFVCGEMKSLYRTLDGGTTWSKIALPGDPSVPIYNVTFLDANVGLVTGNSTPAGPDIYRTTNGGATWSPVTAFPLGGSWYDQDYVSASTGFIGSNGAIVRTVDAGASWELRSFYPNCPSILGMDFADADVGFVAGGLPTFQSGVFKTSDGGVTWTLKFSTPAADVIYLSPTTLLTVTNSGLYRSTDGGEAWTWTSPTPSTGLVDLERFGAAGVAGVSANGDIWRSTDDGSTWTQAWSGESDLPGNWSIRFTTPLLGTVVGTKGLVYRTQDGGLTWKRLNVGVASEMNGIVAYSDQAIVTAGHHGYVQRIEGDGTNWDMALLDPPTFGRDTSYSALSAAGSDFVYAVGHWGGMARSLDAGRTWQNLLGVVSLDYYANDVAFTDPLHGWVVGFDYSVGTPSGVRRTSDGGSTWQAVSAANVPAIGVETLAAHVWIQSAGALQLRSDDNGASFTSVLLPSNSGSSPSVSDLSFANADVGYVCGYHGYLARTLDGGQTWSQLGSLQVNTHFLGVLAHGSELWLCGVAPSGVKAWVKRSTDMGQTWQTWTFGGQYTAPYRMARTVTSLFVTGYNGETWRMDGIPVLPTTYCTAKTNSLGCTPSIAMSSAPSASAGSGCTLSTLDLVGKTLGLYIHSTNGAQALPFHGGWLCVTPPLVRHAAMSSGGSLGICSGALIEDFNSYIASGADPALVAGADVCLQAWSRDPAASFGDNLSNAVSATIAP